MPEQFISELPAAFVKNTLELCGERGRAWLDSIPQVVRELEIQWSITAGRHFRNLSYNFVANVTTADGQPAVLKIALPLKDPEIYGESAYLGCLNGLGAVRLFGFDPERQAILIERCVPGRDLRSVCRTSPDDAIPIAIDILSRVIRPIPETTKLFIKLDDWFDGLRRSGGTSFPSEHARKALEYYEELSDDDENIYLLHGDLHHENILSATREKFLVIDPKGMIGHVGYDIGVFLNNHHNWLDWDARLEARIDKAVMGFADAFGLSELTVRKWAFCQMVLSWWWMYDEMPSVFGEQLGLSDIWKV